MAFFLLSGPVSAQDLRSECRRPQPHREEQAQLERVCGTVSGPGCCTLLLYSRALLFELCL